jgi:hypothetical protein
MTRHVAQLGQRTCFGSSLNKAQCQAVKSQDRRDRSPPSQVVSLALLSMVADHPQRKPEGKALYKPHVGGRPIAVREAVTVTLLPSPV